MVSSQTGPFHAPMQQVLRGLFGPMSSIVSSSAPM